MDNSEYYVLYEEYTEYGMKYRFLKWLKGFCYIIEGIIIIITFGFGYLDLDSWILRKILKYRVKNKNLKP